MNHRLAIALVLIITAPSSMRAQDTSTHATDHSIVGLPALNFDADEGMGYGALVQYYDYGAEGAAPYRYTVQPTVFLTTKGRRDGSIFFDAPHLLPPGWRLSASMSREQQMATPWYGIGNDTPMDQAATSGANPYFYRYGRQRVRGLVSLQRDLGRPQLRGLLAVSVSSTSLTLVPYGTGTTLLATQLGQVDRPRRIARFARAGLVLDTRDREIGPHGGTWAEYLAEGGGAATEYFVRQTLNVRQYVPIGGRLTLAERFVAQSVSGDPPFHELSVVQSSFKDDEALGGAGSLRGIPKNRYVGQGTVFANNELRWDAASFSLVGRPSRLVLSGFVDAGRVWEKSIRWNEITRDLHVSQGVGARLAIGPSFVIATDVGHSSQSTAAVYIGLGYLF